MAHRLNVFLSRCDCLTNTVESFFRQWLMLLLLLLLLLLLPFF
jgi:hypothetical protein